MKLHQLVELLEAVQRRENLPPFYFCGGLVRDRLLGTLDKIDDIDITTGDKSVHNLARETAIELGKQFSIKTSHLEDGHTSIRIGTTKIDFSSNFEMPNIERALQRKTYRQSDRSPKRNVLARFYSQCSPSQTGPQNSSRSDRPGTPDLKAKLLRTCLSPDETLRSNINRIPRVLYLAGKLDFDVDPMIIQWLQQNGSLVKDCKPSYLAKMVFKGMSFNKQRVSELLDKTGIKRFLPKQETDLNDAIDFFRRNLDY